MSDPNVKSAEEKVKDDMAQALRLAAEVINASNINIATSESRTIITAIIATKIFDAIRPKDYIDIP